MKTQFLFHQQRMNTPITVASKKLVQEHRRHVAHICNNTQLNLQPWGVHILSFCTPVRFLCLFSASMLRGMGSGTDKGWGQNNTVHVKYPTSSSGDHHDNKLLECNHDVTVKAHLPRWTVVTQDCLQNYRLKEPLTKRRGQNDFDTLPDQSCLGIKTMMAKFVVNWQNVMRYKGEK